MIQDLVLRQDPPGVGQQEPQEAELRGGEIDGAAPPPHLVGVLVHLEVGEGEPVGARPRPVGPTEDRPDPGDQLLQAERLRDVIVATDRQAADLVLGRVAGREEQDRRRPPPVEQALLHLEPIDVGEHDVEDDEVRSERFDELDRVATVPGRLHVEPLVPKSRRHEVGDVRLVVDDKYPPWLGPGRIARCLGLVRWRRARLLRSFPVYLDPSVAEVDIIESHGSNTLPCLSGVSVEHRNLGEG